MVFSPISGAGFMAQLSCERELYYASLSSSACPMVNGNITGTQHCLDAHKYLFIYLHGSSLKWELNTFCKIRTDMEEAVCYRT